METAPQGFTLFNPGNLLMIHGAADNIVPMHHGQRLFDAARGDKQWWPVENGGHTPAFTHFLKEYRPRLMRYLADKIPPVRHSLAAPPPGAATCPE